MDVIKEIAEYIVLMLVGWSTWATKRIYDLDKGLALNKQNDQQVSKVLGEFKEAIKQLTDSVNELNRKFAEEFGYKNKTK